MHYNFKEIEEKWQNHWAKNQTFKASNDSEKPKYYVLDMFPYPIRGGFTCWTSFRIYCIRYLCALQTS